MATFDELLDKIRRETEGNTSKRGTRFEILMKQFFETDSIWKNQFKKVQMWKDYSGMDGDIDKGIDLVGTDYDGSECAIQCKCWNDDATLDLKDVSTTYADKDRYEKINRVVIVFTGKNLTRHAATHFSDTGTTVLMKDDLRESPINWDEDELKYVVKPKTPRPHQVEATNNVLEKFKQHDRGQLIMACGTGKTLVSLHIGERGVGTGGLILYVVPSIYLIPQAMREWSDNCSIKHQYMAVCSDKTAGNDANGSITEVPVEPSTNVDKLKKKLLTRRNDTLCIIFSTYNSLPVVKEAVNEQFDMILFDEAHKTASSRDSYYTMGHSDENIAASKRLYMTATPRTYSETAKQKNVNVNSMDDEDVYGPVFYKLRFSEARDMGILVPFKITMAEVSEGQLYEDIKAAGEESPDALNDLTKMYGAWQGINYPDGKDKPPKLLQRVIVFHNTVNKSKIFAGEKKSKLAFGQLVEKSKKIYADMSGNVEIKHIDADTRSSSRGMALDWLRKSDDKPDTCRILTNAKCLQEGVDVPALDGIIFMDPRRSGIDIIQSIGRVMRKPKGVKKKAGYVILPIPVPTGDDAMKAFENTRRYGPVRDVLKAIVAHDDELMALINQTNLVSPSGQTNWIPEALEEALAKMLAVNIGSIPEYVKSIVLDLRDVSYYSSYGIKLGKASKRIEVMIYSKIDHEPEISKRIDMLHEDLRAVVGETLTRDDVVKTLSQHIVLYRVFNMLFPDGFNNPISHAMESAMSGLNLDAELEEFKTFYSDVEYDIRLIKTPEERQEFIKKIYDSFLRGADKKGANKHGVVYTPIEIVDFIIHSINHVLKTSFNTSFADPNTSIKVLDPFTGAGTFIARLLEAGIIPHDKLYENYKHNIYANELILLAYYVASVNIEATYQSLMRGHRYVPFDGISFTDTFNQNPQYRLDVKHRKTVQKLDGSFKDAHERVQSQRWAHLHIIIGNPPYSSGQTSADEDNPNTSHPEIEERIKMTYASKIPHIKQKKSLFNSYIKALRWASDRIGNSGIIGFVTPSGWITGNVEAGIRDCIKEEFTDVWCFDLRGQKGVSHDGRNIFEYKGSSVGGTTVGVAISILVKNPKKPKHEIHYAKLDTSDYSGDEKRNRVKQFGSITGISDWEVIPDNPYNDWVNRRGVADKEFHNHMPMGNSKEKKSSTDNGIFNMQTVGVSTARDDWVYNTSTKELSTNMKKHIDYYNNSNLDDFKTNPAQAKKSDFSIERMKRFGKKIRFDNQQIRMSLFRPFYKQRFYYEHIFISRPQAIPRCFPFNNSENLVIIVPNKIKSNFSAFITDIAPDFHSIGTSQCFPIYMYDKSGKRHDNITDYAVKTFRQHYNNDTITRDDIFYYTYGLLHHQGYRDKYQASLVRGLPYIPLAPDFKAFSKSGKRLSKLHLEYENGTRYNLGNPLNPIPDSPKSIQFGSKHNTSDGPKTVPDFSTLYVNGIKIYDNIPDVQYVVNERTPIRWFEGRYKFKTYKGSGNTNYPLEDVRGEDVRAIIERLVYVGVKSDEIIGGLPKEFEPVDWKPKKTGLDMHMNVGGEVQSTL